jgi:hypothetical protein
MLFSISSKLETSSVCLEGTGHPENSFHTEFKAPPK